MIVDSDSARKTESESFIKTSKTEKKYFRPLGVMAGSRKFGDPITPEPSMGGGFWPMFLGITLGAESESGANLPGSGPEKGPAHVNGPIFRGNPPVSGQRKGPGPNLVADSRWQAKVALRSRQQCAKFRLSGGADPTAGSSTRVKNGQNGR